MEVKALTSQYVIPVDNGAGMYIRFAQKFGNKKKKGKNIKFNDDYQLLGQINTGLKMRYNMKQTRINDKDEEMFLDD